MMPTVAMPLLAFLVFASASVSGELNSGIFVTLEVDGRVLLLGWEAPLVVRIVNSNEVPVNLFIGDSSGGPRFVNGTSFRVFQGATRIRGYGDVNTWRPIDPGRSLVTVLRPSESLVLHGRIRVRDQNGSLELSFGRISSMFPIEPGEVRVQARLLAMSPTVWDDALSEPFCFWDEATGQDVELSGPDDRFPYWVGEVWSNEVSVWIQSNSPLLPTGRQERR